MNNELKNIPYLKKSEALVNKFNIFVLSGVFVFAILAEILNLVGIFNVNNLYMIVGMSVATVFIYVPIAMFYIYDGFMKHKNTPESILYKPWFKWIIMTSVYVSVGSLCITLTQHTLLLIVIPPLLSAQYKTNLKLILVVFIFSILLVPISVYGGFFFGNLDRNLIKGLPAEVTNPSIEDRWELAKNGRMVSLFTHYVLPRSLCIFVIDSIIFGISTRFVKLNKESMDMQETINQQMLKTNKMQETVIDSLAAVIENRDTSTGEHVFRTKKYVELICQELIDNPVYHRDLTTELASFYIKAAPLHDVGKIKISDVILLKPAKLNPDEYAKMKTHSAEGREIIRNILTNIEDEGFLKVAENIAAYHHERWDGTGYPEGKKGEGIPLCARIMAIADVFDALASKRVYKEAYSIEESFKIIEESSGSHFDPELVKAFLNIKEKVVVTFTKKE